MSAPPARVLVVDDDPQIRASVHALLEVDFEVTLADSVREAERVLAQSEFDVVLTDYEMPGGTGLQLVESVRAKHPGLSIILITGHAELPAVAGAESDQSVVRVLAKPYDPRRLMLLVHNATRLSRVGRELNAARRR